MKKIFLSSFSVIFTYLFCSTTSLCQATAAASELNNAAAVTAAAESKTSEDSNEIKPKKSITNTEPVLQEEKASDYDLGLKKHSLEFGPEMYSFTYKESGVKTEGIFYGGALNYTFRGWVPNSPDEPLLPTRIPLRAEFRYAAGEADYDGQLSDGTPYKVNDIEYNTCETRLLIGIDVLDKSWLASLYTGVGYRYSADDTSFDPYGYLRESNYLYIPIAYQIDGNFVHNWSWGCNLEVDILAWGEQKSYLSDIGTGLPDIENRQRTGCGLRGAFRLQNKTKAGVLTIEPFIRYWNINQSDFEYVSPYQYWEPKNNTTEYGLQLLWRL